VILEFLDQLIIRSERLKMVHPGKAADLSNCLTYLRTLLSPITTGNTGIQQEYGGTDIISHITASTTSYYLEIITKILLTTG
jgi:hypothetical protein